MVGTTKSPMIRNLVCGLALGCAGVSAAAAATSQAQVSMHCLSLRFEPATAELLGQTYGLEFTTADPQDPANGELTPNGAGSSSHACYYKLYPPDSPDPVLGTFYLNIPDPVDANGDGLADFLEASQAVASTRTSGASEDLLGQHAVQTTWARDAGSSEGMCRLDWLDYGLVFTHRFSALSISRTSIFPRRPWTTSSG